MYNLLTSESVSEGHPDKIADQISDAVLDEIIKKDNTAHVACETFINTGMVLIGGEINTHAIIDIDNIARNTINDIGYNNSNLGFNGNNCAILNSIGKQSKDIFNSIYGKNNEQKAGDQGSVFGYATDETSVFMPAPITYATLLLKKHAELRKSNKLSWLYPDAKSQITLCYKNNKPIYADSIVISTHHNHDINQKNLIEAIIEEIIKPVVPNKWIVKNTKYYINMSGKFVIGGPIGDCGLTGRKIITDTYGGAARHGGGAFSGKDPSKIDRSAAYMSRYIAKNIVAAGLAKKCEIQISYVIGMANPISISINTFNTGIIEDNILCNIIAENFDFRPKSIIKYLNLLRPIYKKTSSYGHFGRYEKSFTWEKIDKKDFLLDKCCIY